MFDLSRFENNIACITPSGEHISYGELQALSERIKGKLSAHQLVFCMCGNTIGS